MRVRLLLVVVVDVQLDVQLVIVQHRRRRCVTRLIAVAIVVAVVRGRRCGGPIVADSVARLVGGGALVLGASVLEPNFDLSKRKSCS